MDIGFLYSSRNVDISIRLCILNIFFFIDRGSSGHVTVCSLGRKGSRHVYAHKINILLEYRH